jgi:hypothetical protein
MALAEFPYPAMAERIVGICFPNGKPATVPFETTMVLSSEPTQKQMEFVVARPL